MPPRRSRSQVERASIADRLLRLRSTLFLVEAVDSDIPGLGTHPHPGVRGHQLGGASAELFEFFAERQDLLVGV